jgi:hypothetical protein
LPNEATVLLLRYLETAGSSAALNLILKARPLSIIENRVGARSERNHLFDHLEKIAEFAAESIRPEISGAVVIPLSN